MNEDEYEIIVKEIRKCLIENGLPDIADIRHYIYPPEIEMKITRRERASYQVIAIRMLSAFQRHLAIQDKATYDKSMSRISEYLPRGRRPEGAMIELSPEMRRLHDLPDVLPLSRAPDLGEVRSRVNVLIDALHEGGHDTSNHGRRNNG